MTEPQQNEYMDTGALTEDAVPEPASSVEEPASVQEPYTEAPGSPSSESVANSSPEESDGSNGPDSGLPHGAKIFASNKEAAQETVAGNPPGDPTLPAANADQQQ